MSDVRIQNQYSVQGAAAKRDPHADSALGSVHRRDEECKRRHREHDSVELSDDSDDAADRPPDENGAQPKDAAPEGKDDAPETPGSHLDVQA